MILTTSIHAWQPRLKRSCARSAAELSGDATAATDAPTEAVQMIFRVAAFPLLPMVQVLNHRGKVLTRVVPASTDLMGFIPEDATHVSLCLPLLL